MGAVSLRRELSEELDVEVEVGAMVGRGQVEVGDKLIVLDVFLCELVAGKIRLREHSACGWFEPKPLRLLDWAAADVPIIEPLTRIRNDRARARR